MVEIGSEGMNYMLGMSYLTAIIVPNSDDKHEQSARYYCIPPRNKLGFSIYLVFLVRIEGISDFCRNND